MWTEETAKEINYEEFPTLEEAYYMSQGIRPTVSDHFDSGFKHLLLLLIVDYYFHE